MCFQGGERCRQGLFLAPHARQQGSGARRGPARRSPKSRKRSEEHTSELQSLAYLVCRLLLEKKKKTQRPQIHTTEPDSLNLPPTHQRRRPPPPDRLHNPIHTPHQLELHYLEYVSQQPPER